MPVPMRDGVRLMANIFRPAQAGRYPVVMSVSPYGKDVLPEDRLVTLAEVMGQAAIK